MRIAGFRPTSLFDGKGINAVVFTQGCVHGCNGCQNPSTWDKSGGTEVSVEDVEAMISPYLGFITGITFSGGDPVEQYEDIAKIAVWAKDKGLHTTLYTGYLLSDVMEIALRVWVKENGIPNAVFLKDLYETAKKDEDFLPFDTIIDGTFDEEKKSSDCAFRGSKNQTIWEKMTVGSYYPIDYDENGEEELLF